MNGKRYAVYGGVSLALHSVMLFASPPKKEINVSMESNIPAINLQFVSAPKLQKSAVEPPPVTKNIPKEKATKTAKPVEASKNVVKPKATKTVKAPQRIEKQPIAKKVTKATTPPVSKKAQKPPTSSQNKLEVAAKPITKENKSTSIQQKKKPVDETNTKESAVVKSKAVVKNKAVVAKSSTPKLIEKPTYRAKPTPIHYPRLAKRRGHQGKVLIEVWIDRQGTQTKRLILDSSGFSSLDEAAIKAISKWKFHASTEQGKAIAHRVQIPINFKLDR